MHQNNQLQKVSHDLDLSPKEETIAKEVFKVNMIIPYPLSDLQICDWAKHINIIYPDIPQKILESIFLKFMKDDIEWNNKKGIQNILQAIKYELDPQREFLDRL